MSFAVTNVTVFFSTTYPSAGRVSLVLRITVPLCLGVSYIRWCREGCSTTGIFSNVTHCPFTDYCEIPQITEKLLNSAESCDFFGNHFFEVEGKTLFNVVFYILTLCTSSIFLFLVLSMLSSSTHFSSGTFENEKFSF